MTARRKKEGRVYVRRSTSKQESGIYEQLAWAVTEASKYGITLDGCSQDLDHMLAHGLQHYKHIYLDDGISGSNLNRPGFVAFREEARANPAVSHLFIHLSDRFSRPEQAVQAMQVEIDLVVAGLTIVFANRVSEPRERGMHHFDRDILLLYEYTQNGEFLVKLAMRVVQTQLHLARQGYRTGGSAPYGFIRVLVDAQGNEIQELPEGTTIRREGCHVILKPHDMAKIQTWLLILHLYGEKRWGLHRIANYLNALGIPSPQAGKVWRIRGRLQVVSGRWTQPTVSRLIDDADIIGLSDYGRRSEGSHRRVSVAGPRTLQETDRRSDGQAKQIRNDSATVLTSPVQREACADPKLFQTCQSLRQQRAQHRLGITRSTDLAKYPLATRIFDASPGCGKVLYGRQKRQRTGYACSRYMRSGGQECHHHWVDGEATLACVLDVLRQQVQRCGGREALRQRLVQLAAAQKQGDSASPLVNELELAQRRLADGEAELKTIARNLARAGDDDQVFAVIKEEYKAKEAEVEQARQQVERLRGPKVVAPALTADQEVEAAMQLFEEIERVTTDRSARAEIPQMLRKLDVKLWLKFGEVVRGKQSTRVVQSGILTMGDGRQPYSPQEGEGDNRPGPSYGVSQNSKAVPAPSDGMSSSLHKQSAQEGECSTIDTLGERRASAR